MTKIWRITTLVGYFGLLSLLVAWTAWLAPPQALPRSLVLIMLVGPLLFLLRGILYGRTKAHLGIGLLAIFYFVAGIFNSAGGIEQNWLAWVEVGLSVLLFCGALGYVRSAKQ
jgi:uncharacterized membrane protein